MSSPGYSSARLRPPQSRPPLHPAATRYQCSDPAQVFSTDQTQHFFYSRALGYLEKANRALQQRRTVSATCQNIFDTLSKASGRDISLGTIQAAMYSASFRNGLTANLPVSTLYTEDATQAGIALQNELDAKGRRKNNCAEYQARFGLMV